MSKLDPIIQTKGLEIIYNQGKSNEFKALHGETLEIYPQEYIILFGPSGCGKSTMLYTILGALPPSSGEIMINGENPYAYNAEQLVRFQQKTIGIIYQSFNLIPSLNVLDNVALPQIFASIPSGEREERAMQLLKRFGIDNIAYKLPGNLSGGQMQRVAVARSLVMDPQILLADEPVGNLDSISAEAVMNTLEEINQRDKKTIILVTHDAKYLPYAHRIFYVRDGRLEREVVNPEKPQIKKVEAGKTITTEIEKLARMYPYSSPDELKVKSLVNYMTQDMSFDQLNRLEEFVKLMIEGRVADGNFKNVLQKSFDDGGIGLSEHSADEMTLKIKRVLEEARDIRRYRTKLERGTPSERRDKLIERLRVYLLEEYGGQITLVQLRRLEEAIAKRVSGFTKMEDFQNFLDMPIEKGGAGMNAKTARHLGIYLEKLLAQGVQI